MRNQRYPGGVDQKKESRSGTIIVLGAVLLVVACGFAAFAIDLGYICRTKGQLQNAADAAALAGIHQLAKDRRASTGVDADQAIENAREAAVDVAYENAVANVPPVVDREKDVIVGQLTATGDVVPVADPRLANAISVKVRRTEGLNGPLKLFFAPVLGVGETDLDAYAVASLDSQVRGFRPKPDKPPSLLPFTIHIDDWRKTLDGQGPDVHMFDEELEVVSTGSDGLYEMDMFTGVLNAAGSFGTLQIGRSNPSMGSLVKQIKNGITSDDLQQWGGEISLDDSGQMYVTSDPGMGTPILREVAKLIGEPRTLFLYEGVSGGGAQAVYRIVGFAGVRIVAVQATGPLKYITIQPAVVVDETAITGPGGENSWFVSSPPKLTQ